MSTTAATTDVSSQYVDDAARSSEPVYPRDNTDRNSHAWTNSAQSDTELRRVYVLYRHGDRSPTFIYPTDKHTVDVWPDGLGWLTRRGIRQQYEFGQFLREHYVDRLRFLSPRYRHNEVHIRSTDYARTLMSAQANLAGLFPPTDDQRWSGEIPWQPIPVRCVPTAEDILLNGGDCKRGWQLQRQILASAAAKRIEADNRNLFSALSKGAGMHITLANLPDLFGTLFCEREHNLTRPAWLTEPLWTGLVELNDRAQRLQYANREFRRLEGGVLAWTILTDFARLATGVLPPRSEEHSAARMTIYSAHDMTVMALLSALHVFPGRWPLYTAAVFVELHRDRRNGAHYVRIFYRHSPTDTVPRQLKPPNCGPDDECTLGELRSLVAAEMLPPSKYRAACATTEAE